jgi:nucleoid DNA-binding protein
MLTKSQIVERIASDGVAGKHLVKNVLDALAELAAEEISRGENFTIPGVVNIKWRYTTPRKKGELYKKGDTYTGFGGVEQVAEEDSKARKQSIKLKANLTSTAAKAGKEPSAQRKAINKAKK